MSIFAPGTPEQLSAQWGKGPHVFRSALLAPMFTADEFMAGVVGISKEYIANQGVLSSRVFIAGEPATVEQLRPFLLLSQSETLEEYTERLRRAYPKDEISIILDKCDRHIPAIRERLTPLLHAVFSRVGYPARPNHACIYAGSYTTTPMGIHRDYCHVLMFSGVGSRRMAVWPRSYFEPRKELFIGGKLYARLQDHIAHALVFEIGPLDILYVPPNDWHIGTSSNDEFHAGLSTAILDRASSAEKFLFLDFLRPPKYESDSAKYDAMDICGLLVASRGRLSAEDLSATDLAGFFQQWSRVRDLLNRPGEAERRALEIILTSASSAGFGKLLARPSSANQNLKGSILECSIPEALMVAPAAEGLMVGANGSIFFYRSHVVAIENLILDLRSGKSLGFDDILASTGAACGEMLGSVIKDLVTAGAIVAYTFSSGPQL